MKHFTDNINASVFVILNNKGGIDGRIIVKWSQAGNATAGVLSITLGTNYNKTGRAGGGGYDKESAAICYALEKHGYEPKFDSCGMSAVSEWFRKHNLTIHQLV